MSSQQSSDNLQDRIDAADTLLLLSQQPGKMHELVLKREGDMQTRQQELEAAESLLLLSKQYPSVEEDVLEGAILLMALSSSQHETKSEVAVSKSHQETKSEVAVSKSHLETKSEVAVSKSHLETKSEVAVSKPHQKTKSEVAVSKSHLETKSEVASSKSHETEPDVPTFEEYRQQRLEKIRKSLGGVIVKSNPNMRRCVYGSNAPDASESKKYERYKTIRNKNNESAKKSRDRQKVRRIENEIKKAFYKLDNKKCVTKLAERREAIRILKLEVKSAMEHLMSHGVEFSEVAVRPILSI